MKEVYPDLFVGSESDLFSFAKVIAEKAQACFSNEESYYIVHAAKEPYHRQALGYTARGAPKDHPNYLWLEKGQRLILNLVDVNEAKAEYIPVTLLHKAVDYINWAIAEKHKPVFIHCNEGKSRAPSIALMYILKHTQNFEQCDTFKEVEAFFKSMCPDYQPNGIRVKVKEFWESCQQPIGGR